MDFGFGKRVRRGGGGGVVEGGSFMKKMQEFVGSSSKVETMFSFGLIFSGMFTRSCYEF